MRVAMTETTTIDVTPILADRDSGRTVTERVTAALEQLGQTFREEVSDDA